MVFASQIVGLVRVEQLRRRPVRSSGTTTKFCCCPRGGFKIQRVVSARTESLVFHGTVNAPVPVTYLGRTAKSSSGAGCKASCLEKP